MWVSPWAEGEAMGGFQVGRGDAEVEADMILNSRSGSSEAKGQQMRRQGGPLRSGGPVPMGGGS